MIRQLLLSATFALGIGSAGQAATIDLASLGLQLSGGPIASSASMSISDTAPFDLGFVVIPAFFQALDSGANPALELNTGDGLTFNLSVTPSFTGISTEIAREGDRQLELLFDIGGTDQAFARLNLAVGDSLDNILTGASFGDASLNVWEVESTSTTPIPLPAGLPLLISAMVGLGVLARRKKR